MIRAFALAAVLSADAGAALAQQKLMDWPDLLARPAPKATARVAGDIRAWTYAIPGEGHVEEIAPGSKTWAAVAAGVESVFRSRDHSWPIEMKTPSL